MTQNKDKEQVTLPVYLMIRRKKTTIFIEALENTKVVELKKMLECLTRKLAEDVRLFRENSSNKSWIQMENMKNLSDLGFTNGVCTPQSPGTIGLVYRLEGNEFELVDITPLSTPPELPEVMKNADITQDLLPVKVTE